MRIGGFQKISLIDYPGKVAAVVFTQGCNFRCGFCHNLPLVIPSCFTEPLSEEEIINFLKARLDKLQGVVVTGGEPTLQSDLPAFLEKIKAMGYRVKLDTNGSRPEMLHRLLAEKLVDFVAMDIKGPIRRYAEIAGVAVDTENIRKSVSLILEAGIEYQFRTTFPKPVLTEGDLPEILDVIHGAERFVLQPFVPQENLIDNKLLDKAHYQEEEFEQIRLHWEGSLTAGCQR